MTTTGARALMERERFDDLTDTCFLYTGAHSPSLRTVRDALAGAQRTKSAGAAGRDVMFAAEREARSRIATVTGASSDDVAFVGDASTAWNSIANSWDWEPGDNVVLNTFEHPSVYLPWMRLREYGLEVRFAEHDASWSLPVEAVAKQCDDRTRAIAMSHVGYVTGLRNDLADWADCADRVGAPLLVDASHSLGVLPVDMCHAAVVVSASYKWLLGPYGVGIVVWNRDRLPDLTPGVVGWRSIDNMFDADRFERLGWHPDAQRFQVGAPALAAIAGLSQAAGELLDLDASDVAAHALALSGSAIDALDDLGLDVITPRDPSHRGGNVAFRYNDGERLAADLAREGVLAWGGDGRVRASFHVMNDLGDVERFHAALARTVHRPAGV